VPGGQYHHDGVAYIAADLRTARCSGGEGELPFQVGAGWEATVADYRQTHRFLTLDYSDGSPPRRYVGKAVTLADLKCQLLREPDEIARSAGHLKGAAEALACPACGASIAGARASPSSSTARPAAPPRCQRRHRGGARRRPPRGPVVTTLALGDEARIDGIRWRLIGLLRCREQGASEEWTEYLLYSERQGFLWLVESDAGWDKVRVLDTWPESVSASAVRLDGAAYTRMQAYGAEVVLRRRRLQLAGEGRRQGEHHRLPGQPRHPHQRAGQGRARLEPGPAVPASTVDGWFGKGGKLAAAAPASPVRSKAARPTAACAPGLGVLGAGAAHQRAHRGGGRALQLGADPARHRRAVAAGVHRLDGWLSMSRGPTSFSRSSCWPS
jgi:hypothetical protein